MTKTVVSNPISLKHPQDCSSQIYGKESPAPAPEQLSSAIARRLKLVEDCHSEVRQTSRPALSNRIKSKCKEIELFLSEVEEIYQRSHELASYAAVKRVNGLKARLEQFISERAELDGQDQSIKTHLASCTTGQVPNPHIFRGP